MEQTANTAKVLEDEVTVLKGEIKLILVRKSVRQSCQTKVHLTLRQGLI